MYIRISETPTVMNINKPLPRFNNYLPLTTYSRFQSQASVTQQGEVGGREGGRGAVPTQEVDQKGTEERDS